MGEVSCEGGLGPRSHLDQRTNRCSGDKRQVGPMACGRKQRNAAISLSLGADLITMRLLRASAYVGDQCRIVEHTYLVREMMRCEKNEIICEPL